MRYRIFHMLSAITLIGVLLALWVYETGPPVVVDAAYEISLAANLPKGFDSKATYSLVDKSNLEEVLRNYEIHRDYESGITTVPIEDLPQLPSSKDYHVAIENILVPRTQLVSPLFGRDLGATEPYDCIIFCFEHENGASSIMIKYHWRWVKEGLIQLEATPEMESAMKDSARRAG